MRGLGKAIRNYYEKAIFILTGGFNRAIRHSRRSGNPEPFLPSNLMRVCRKWSSWDVDLSTRRVLVGITVSAHDQGSGFPQRRE